MCEERWVWVRDAGWEIRGSGSWLRRWTVTASLIWISRGEPVPINTEGSRQQQRRCLDHRPCSICSVCFPLTLFSHHPPYSPQTSKYFCFCLLLAILLWGKQQFSRFGRCNYWSQTTMAVVNFLSSFTWPHLSCKNCSSVCKDGGVSAVLFFFFF